MTTALITCVAVMVLGGCPGAPATAPAAQRVQFRLVAADGDRDAEVVRLARPDADELELRLLRDVVLDGSGVERAQADRDMTLGQWTVSVTFTEAGSERLFEVTRDNLERRLAMVVDGLIVTAPTIRSPIRSSAEINGAFDRARAEELVKAINDAARGAGTQPSR
jgi:preprotein translocase subunit SecD